MSETDKTIQDILIALSKMEKSQEITIKNVDKLSLFINKLAPWDERMKNSTSRISQIEKDIDEGVKPKTLKNLLVGGLTVLIAYLSWLSLSILAIDKEYTKTETKQIEINKSMKKDILRLNDITNDNKNQITYLKGRLK